MRFSKIRPILAGVVALCLTMNPLAVGIPAVSAAEQEEVVIHAQDYEVDPTGERDSTEGIIAALAAAKTAKTNNPDANIRLEFPQGTYNIYKDKCQTRKYHTSNTNSIENPTKTIGILIEEQHDLTLDGNGSLFMIHGDIMALAVAHSTNIKLEDFSWDFAVPTVSEMTVTDMGTVNGRQYTDFLIPECFPHQISGRTIVWNGGTSPYTNQYYWTRTGVHENTYAVIAYQPSGEMSRNYYPGDGPFTGVSSIEELDSTHVRIYYSGSRPSMQQMGTVIQMASNDNQRTTAGAFIWESENVTSRRINVHFMHGFGWLLQMSNNVYFYDCNIAPREGSGHMASGFADGIHASGAKGDIVIENCNFSGTHDDPINLHGTFTRVERRISDKKLQLNYIHRQQGGFPQYHVGDKVAFYTRDYLQSTDNETLYTVKAVTGPTDDSPKTMEVEFEETLPANLSDKIGTEPKYVAENVSYTPKVTIRGCTFRNVPTRGILCTTRQPVLIENNTFYNMSMATIFLSNDSNDWYESGPIRDMTIRGNTFYIKSIGRTNPDPASAVWIHPVTKGGNLPSADTPIHKNITIEENTFYMDADRVVRAESVENLTIRNNKIMRANPVQIQIAAAQADEDGSARVLEGSKLGLTVNAQWRQYNQSTENVYEFKRCKNVVLEGNTYDEGLKKYAVLDNTPEGNVTNRDADITVTTNGNLPASAPEGEIQFESSNPEVLSVDRNGRMTGLRAGTATVCAYFEQAGRRVLSNSVTVTVVGKEELDPQDVVTITGSTDVQTLDQADAQLTFQASVPSGKEITWTVTDFLTGGRSDAAEVSADGVLTAKKNGIVWVEANCGLSSDRRAVIISVPETDTRNPGLSITREDKANYTLSGDQITVDMQSGDLYQTDNTVPNLFLYTVPESISKSNLRTVIKVDNLPIVESGQWDTASFILYKNDDNYITAGKKSHFNGITTVSETAAAAVETGGNASENNLTTAWLGFYKNGNTVSVDFKTDGGSWQHVRDLSADMIGNDYKIGFTAWETHDRSKTATFSEFRVGSGELSYDQLCAQDAISFTKTTQAPTVSQVQFDQESYKTGQTANVTYSYTDPDGDEEGETRYCFTYANGIQVVTDEPSVVLRYAGEVCCQVYAVDANGRPASAAAEARVMVEQGEDTSAAKQELAAEITEAEKVDLSKYTETTVAAFQEALTAARNLAADEGATKEELQQALQTLRDAKANLEEKEPPIDPVDPSAAKQELTAEITEAEKVDLSKYTETTVAAFQEALTAARNLAADEGATKEELHQALQALRDAKANLEEKKPPVDPIDPIDPVDPADPAAVKQELTAKIAEAEKVDLSKYTETTVAAFQEALKEAKKLADDPTASKEKLEQALQALRDASAKLEKLTESLKPQPSDQGGTNTPKPVEQDPKPAVQEAPKKGDLFEVKGIQYRIVNADAKKGTVAAVKLTNKKKAKVVIPSKVAKNGYSYKVVSIDKKAFAKNKRIKQAVIGANVKNIGKQAFYKCSKLKQIRFKGKKAPKFGAKAFQKTNASCKVYVPKKMSAKQFNRLKKQIKKAGIGKKAVIRKK